MKKLLYLVFILPLIATNAFANPYTNEYCNAMPEDDICEGFNLDRTRIGVIEAHDITQDVRISNLEEGGEGVFDLIVVDAETDEQVGVFHANYVFKTIGQGYEGFQFGYPQPMPIISVTTETKKWAQFNGFADFDCFGNLLNWRAGYIIQSTANQGTRLDPQSSQINTYQQFGTLQNGDVVTANITQEDSVIWGDNYNNLEGATPGNVPVLTSAPMDCFHRFSWTNTGPTENPRELGDSDFPPWNLVVNNSITIQSIQATEASVALLPGDPTRFFLSQQTFYVSAEISPAEIDARCVIGGFTCPMDRQTLSNHSSGLAFYNYVQSGSPSPFLVTQTKTVGVTDIVPIEQVPGNDGTERFFDIVWR